MKHTKSNYPVLELDSLKKHILHQKFYLALSKKILLNTEMSQVQN